MTEQTGSDEIGSFWELARFHAKLNVAPAYFGPTTLEVVRPPAWSYGETPEEADAFVAGLDAGEPIATHAPAAAYEEDGAEMPVAGALSILCDGAGHPVALLEVEEVEVGDEVVEHFRVVYRNEQ
ncbi:hypothetical protein [Nocardioides currus]|uniref:ASCH domain-containing protein n=1 Tax=Nocardioides currus TaxID=2133958 RepID=A0A2R7YV79_9ACTN|nr:hypothetical protein [Nocardioides currus]PUA79976.1 hypothetical protein C7S10_15570 [Nocardioides currus]